MTAPGALELPHKPFLSEQVLMEIWEGRGMKWRIDELHRYFRDNGLLPPVHRMAFRHMIFDAIRDHMVVGVAQRNPEEIPPSTFVKTYDD